MELSVPFEPETLGTESRVMWPFSSLCAPDISSIIIQNVSSSASYGLSTDAVRTIDRTLGISGLSGAVAANQSKQSLNGAVGLSGNFEESNTAEEILHKFFCTPSWGDWPRAIMSPDDGRYQRFINSRERQKAKIFDARAALNSLRPPTQIPVDVYVCDTSYIHSTQWAPCAEFQFASFGTANNAKEKIITNRLVFRKQKYCARSQSSVLNADRSLEDAATTQKCGKLANSTLITVNSLISSSYSCCARWYPFPWRISDNFVMYFVWMKNSENLARSVSSDFSPMFAGVVRSGSAAFCAFPVERSTRLKLLNFVLIKD